MNSVLSRFGLAAAVLVTVPTSAVTVLSADSAQAAGTTTVGDRGGRSPSPSRRVARATGRGPTNPVTLRVSEENFQAKTADSLVNFGPGFRERNQATFARFADGAAFAGVYDEASRSFLAHPNGNTRLGSGQPPENLVARNGGHKPVNEHLAELAGVDRDKTWGFVLEGV
jgi:hypothetical protein